MLISIRKGGLVKMVSSFIYDLPSPSMLSYMWNFGSMLGVMLGFQILSGMFLVMHYTCGVEGAFFSIIHIMRDVNWGWAMRVFHSNGASLFFLLLYVHMGRGWYYGGYVFESVWMSGVSLFLVSMGVAFLGYVLPWGQMSFWAATVITNLLSAIPYLGRIMVEWVWGGFAVGDATLLRFFCLHYFLPFVILGLVVVHLLFLHEEGSGNPMGMKMLVDSVWFHSGYVYKDLVGLGILFYLLFVFSVGCPYLFMDGENFIEANPLVTPVHIQPEWYFLFAYAILRSVPSKIGGVVSLFMSVMVFYFFPWVYSGAVSGVGVMFFSRLFYWWFLVVWGVLTWNGACEVIYPFIWLGECYSVMYFLMILVVWGVFKMEEWMVK